VLGRRGREDVADEAACELVVLLVVAATEMVWGSDGRVELRMGGLVVVEAFELPVQARGPEVTA
jgi:hypothetical protein